MPKRFRSSVDFVQREVERMIFTGELVPGEHVKEQLLADQLGVSRSPVREACRALEWAGLLRSVPNRGVFVREVSLRGAMDLFDVRAELSAIVAREAVHNVSPRAIREMEALIEEMDRAAEAEDPDAYLSLNIRFHEMLYSLADNRRVVDLDRNLGNELLIYRRRGLASGGGIRVSNHEHRKILAALAQNRPAELRDILRRHILGGKMRFLAAMQHKDLTLDDPLALDDGEGEPRGTEALQDGIMIEPDGANRN